MAKPWELGGLPRLSPFRYQRSSAERLVVAPERFGSYAGTALSTCLWPRRRRSTGTVGAETLYFGYLRISGYMTSGGTPSRPNVPLSSFRLSLLERFVLLLRRPSERTAASSRKHIVKFRFLVCKDIPRLALKNRAISGAWQHP